MIATFLYGPYVKHLSWIIRIVFLRADDGAIKRIDALLFSSEISKKLSIVLDGIT